MSDFVSIKDAIAQKKGDFVGTVINVSDLKSGTTDNRDWTLKVFTIRDESGEIEFLAWNDAERNLLKLNCTYEFINPWYKMKKDKVIIQASQFGKINEIKSEAPPAEIPPRQVETPTAELPELSAHLADKVAQNTVLFMQVKEEIKKTIVDVRGDSYFNAMDKQEFGLMCKEIFRATVNAIPKEARP